MDSPVSPTPELPPTPVRVRVLVQHSPTLFSLLGLHLEGECTPVLTLGARTYYLAKRTPRWVFYKPAALIVGPVHSHTPPVTP